MIVTINTQIEIICDLNIQTDLTQQITCEAKKKLFLNVQILQFKDLYET